MESCDRQSCKDILLTIRGEEDDYRRSGLRYSKRNTFYYNQGIRSLIAYFTGRGSDYQYFPDCDLHTGADPYFCTKDNYCFFRANAVRFLDAQYIDGIYNRTVE